MWKLPSSPNNEIERLKVLMACNIMDTSRDDRFDRLTRLASRIYKADAAFIGLVDANYQWMKANTSPVIAPVIERRFSVCNLIIESGDPLVVPDLKTDPRLEGHPIVPHLTLRFYAGVPLVADADLVIGSMCVMRRAARTLSGFDIEPLKELAAIAVDEIELWKLTSELRRKAEVDSLTGLANRRIFDEEIERSVRRARRTRDTLSLLLLDLDRFKQLNDLAGHQAGDEVLKIVGRLLSTAISRPLDLAARYGGEEFAVILPETDIATACAIAESIRAGLASAMLPHPSGGIVSASIGVSSQSDGQVEASSLIAEADIALYRAKRLGRDQVNCLQL